MEIWIGNLQRGIRIDTVLLKGVAHRILEDLDQAEAECGVLIVSDKRIASLNATYRGISAVTDVLAFPMQEGPGSQWCPHLLGDVVISAERALAQAKAVGHSFEYEMCFLLAHGLLHLLGWDDSTRAGLKRMLEVQKDLLQKILLQTGEGRAAGDRLATRTAR